MRPIEFNKFHYAGIGSRQITKNTSLVMMQYACCMAFYGGKVSSGKADGSDTSFETGAKVAYDAMVQIFPELPPRQYSNVLSVHLPWPGFNGQQVNEYEGYFYTEPTEASLEIVKKYHPAGSNLAKGPKSMMARNTLQVMDRHMNRLARFVVCETPDGAYTGQMTSFKSGGTGQAIRIASDRMVNVYNLKHPPHFKKITDWINDADAKIKEEYGVSPKNLIDDFLSSHIGIKRSCTGNLVEMALNGEIDVLVHGCNLSSYNAGIAKEIRNKIPQAYDSFLNTKKGDIKKLGTIDTVDVIKDGKAFSVVNAFVQPKYGRDPSQVYVDYQALRKCFKQIAKDFDRNKIIAIPRIGAGLANGCWVTISNIISQEMAHHNILLVDFDETGLVNTKEPNFHDDGDQLGLSL